MNIEDISKLASTIQAIATIIAFTLGGIWTYTTFIRRRQRQPHADILHLVSSRRLMEGKVVLSVDVIVKNIGEVLLPLTTGETQIRQMVPPPGKLLDDLSSLPTDQPGAPQQYGWTIIALAQQAWKAPHHRMRGGKVEIEPGESQSFHYDFILDGSIQTVKIWTHMRNPARPRDPGFGWDQTTIFDIGSGHTGPGVRPAQEQIGAASTQLDGQRDASGARAQ